MTSRAALELDTLTIHIPMRLQRRGGRKLILTPEGAAVPARTLDHPQRGSACGIRAHPLADLAEIPQLKKRSL